MLWVIYNQAADRFPDAAVIIGQTVALIFFVFAVAAGISTWFLVLAHDTRRVAEEESARQNALLQKEIDAHRVTDAALQKAKEDAEAANLAKSRYVVGLSHELRTPLNAVLGYAQVLERDDALPESRKSNVSTIRRSAEHLSGLIDGLLDISRIEAGRLQVYSNEVNIHDFLDQIVDMFKMQAAARGLEFEFIKAKNLPVYVRTDEKRLRQILVNLLSNAIKFTDTGKVSLDVGYRSQVATFTVTDTGPGIPLSEQTKIFEPFGRSEDEKTRRTPGLGLGLTITKLLAETLGGAIALSSEPGRGSTFEVRLMLAEVARPVKVRPPEQRIRGYAGKRRTIAVVDDNPDHRALIREILTPLGFDLLEADSGAACLETVGEAGVDLFLVDILMPGMNGWELVRRLREDGVDQPVIMLSANIGDQALRPDGPSLHDDTLAKPFDLRQLLDKIQKHLDLTWTADEAKDKPDAPRHGRCNPVINPGNNHVRELISLGGNGYYPGIEAKLAELSGTPENGPLVTALRGHLKQFDFDSYTKVLEGLAADD